MDTLYKEELLDHYREPRYWGRVERCDFTKVGINPFCGDTICLSGRLKNGRLAKVNFTAQGCAISIAAASILMEYIQRKSIVAVQEMPSADMLKLLGIPLTPTRVKCGLLAWDTLKEALHECGQE